MSSPFELALAKTLLYEGVYSDDPADRGGETRFGITREVARHHGYGGAMNELPMREASRIYRIAYWDPYHLDTVAVLSPPIAHLVFDMAVNHGEGGMSRLVQRASRALGREVKVDGRWGPITEGTVIRLASDYPESFLGALKGERYKWYEDIVRARPDQAKFFRGWVKRCA